MTLFNGITRDRRVLIIGAMISAAAFALVRGRPPVAAWYAGQREAAIELRVRADRAIAAVRAAAHASDSLNAETEALDSMRPRLFSGGSANVVMAEVASYVARAARAASIEVGAVQVRPDTASVNGTRRIILTATAHGDIDGLMTLLSTLEAGPKFFRVASITVTQPDVVGAQPIAENLGIELTLVAMSLDRGAR